MIGFSSAKTDLHQLRLMVEQRLCELGHLETEQFPLTLREVVRAGKTCGIYFCLHGPRSVKLTAICDFNTKSLIYYGSDGVRRETVELPTLAKEVLSVA